jgi:hypothetical protein
MSFQSTPSKSTPDGTPRLRLLDQARETIRRRYYSRRTGEAYVHWIKRFSYFTGKRHPPRWARRKSPYPSASW